MNYDDIGKLIARVKVGDNRDVGKVGLLHEEWFQSLGHLPLDECLAAVILHRQESPGVYLEAGHIIANVRLVRARQERAQRVVMAKQRGAIAAPVITLDRDRFEAETQAAIRAHRISRGRDPDTGKLPDSPAATS